MAETDDRPAFSSQESSLFPLEPVQASVLCAGEAKRRNVLKERGPLHVGCSEIDDSVLLGGFERGCVVGISAEEEEFGVMLGLQTVAHAVCSSSSQRAIIITTTPPGAAVSPLRDAVRAQLEASDDVQGETRRCLEQISISRVFDFEGLWEVLGDLSCPPTPVPATEEQEPETAKASTLAEEVRGQKLEGDPVADSTSPRSEIADSEDGSGFSPLATPANAKMLFPDSLPRAPPPSPAPDIILITHFHALMSELFTRRDKTSAHSAMQLLSSHLRHLSRTLPSSPLILLTNKTTTKEKEPATSSTPIRGKTPISFNPTLRSIFSSPMEGHGHHASSQNKPSFGLVFTQLLDIHLLCTRVPRRREDAEALVLGGKGALFVWVVECILDEMGVWERKRKSRRSREGRWGATDVESARIVEAFKREDNGYGESRPVKEFPGRRE